MVDATVVTNDGMHYALEGVKMGVTNEVHETARLLMLAGRFDTFGSYSVRFITSATVWKRRKTLRLRKKLKPVVQPPNNSSPRPAGTGRSYQSV